MSSAHPSFSPNLPYSSNPPTTDRDRPRLLKAQLAVYILILTFDLALLLQLVAHFAATQEVEDFGMPPGWKRDFVAQLVGGNKMVTWIVVFLCVPCDGTVALGCVAWYGNLMYDGAVEMEVEWRRGRFEEWIVGVCGRVGRWNEKYLWSAREGHGTQESETSRATDHEAAASSHRTSPPTSVLHALLFPALTHLERLLLRTLWSILLILALTSHIYIFATNLAPSSAFCSQNQYPSWHFPDPGPRSYQPKLSLGQRCKKINVGIRWVGGYSSGSAGILGVLHFFALSLGVVEYFFSRRRRNGENDTEKGKERTEENALEMQDWAYAPRDIDIRSRKSSIRDCDEGEATREATGRMSAISQEEANVGVQRRGRGRRRDGSSHTNDTRSSAASGKWERLKRSEGLMECLVE
jgi:hypothetical protein